MLLVSIDLSARINNFRWLQYLADDLSGYFWRSIRQSMELYLGHESLRLLTSSFTFEPLLYSNALQVAMIHQFNSFYVNSSIDSTEYSKRIISYYEIVVAFVDAELSFKLVHQTPTRCLEMEAVPYYTL
jgi:hypothetical protein